MHAKRRSTQIFLLFLLLAAVALPGCTQSETASSTAPIPVEPGEPAPEHHRYPWYMQYGAGAGSGMSSGSGRHEIQLPPGIETLTFYLNWTCPYDAACEARISVRHF